MKKLKCKPPLYQYSLTSLTIFCEIYFFLLTERLRFLGATHTNIGLKHSLNIFLHSICMYLLRSYSYGTISKNNNNSWGYVRCPWTSWYNGHPVYLLSCKLLMLRSNQMNRKGKSKNATLWSTKSFIFVHTYIAQVVESFDLAAILQNRVCVSGRQYRNPLYLCRTLSLLQEYPPSHCFFVFCSSSKSCSEKHIELCV